MSGKKSYYKIIILLFLVVVTILAFYDANYGSNNIGTFFDKYLNESGSDNDSYGNEDDLAGAVPAGSIVIEEDGKSTFVPYGKGFMHFTRDGVKFYSSLGALSWNDVYTIVSPVVVTGGSYSAVIDILGKTARVYNESGLVYTIQTDESICYAALNKNGNAVLILNGKNDYRVQVYNSSGKLKFQRFDEDAGVYPVCADISDDNNVLAVSYTDTSDIDILSKVLFFYTSKTEGSGADMFAACEVKDEIVVSLNFMSADEYACVSDKAVFAVDSSGETVWRNETGNEIRSFAFSEEGYMAVGYGKEILSGAEAEKEGTVVLYNFGGRKTGTAQLDGDISDIYAGEYYAVACADDVFYGIKANGNILWEYAPLQDVSAVIPVDNSGKVLYVASNHANIKDMSR
ncbi:MAG: hypothetical protein E7235_03770 [Lachnospiraceae bacterium]|nr:hypothetical protein [Lachnospiraceae bacterium]